MSFEGYRVRVLIGTTEGPVEIESLIAEDAALARSVVCIGGGTETAGIDRDYHAFVDRGTGLIARLYGHDRFRLDVSGPVDVGSSWQLPVFAAHALYAAGRLAAKGEEADTVLFATGRVQPLNEAVLEVGHVDHKLRRALERLQAEASRSRIVVALPKANGSAISAGMRASLDALGARIVVLESLAPLRDTLGLQNASGLPNASASPKSEIVPSPATARVEVVARPRPSTSGQRWFLSYNTQDFAAASKLYEALRSGNPGVQIFFAPKSLQGGNYWLPELAKEIAEATAFVLFIGPHGVGPWQEIEYYDAFDKRSSSPDFPLILVLQQGQTAPGLPFLRQLHWIVSADPASAQTIALIEDATTEGKGKQPEQLWRHTAPYRGLAAMTEADSDFFFGRTRETVEVIEALQRMQGRLPIMLGNSGVGKSSLAQAGVVASLKRQSWPLEAEPSSSWPLLFAGSRRWCFLTMQPGTEPLRSLVSAFISTWQFEATDPRRETQQSEWVKALQSGNATLRSLLDATERRCDELGLPKPPHFFLYVDQGEELYVRSEALQRQRFSEALRQGLTDERLSVLMSMRSDFFGHLQNDAELFAVHQQINVAPLREEALREVVEKPPAVLGARFESEGVARTLAQRAAEESVKDAGALPLLSYLLDDMWTQMVARADGVLRLPPQALELGGVLAERANLFLAHHPNAEDQVRRILTLKLARVRDDGEPTRRRAQRSEFNDEEWRLVSELADHPNRLLITGALDTGEAYAEVAHEAIFRHWDKLKEWIASEREFLAWKSSLEAARRAWQNTPERSRNDALLMGLPLAQAQGWFTARAEDLPSTDRDFIAQSIKRETTERNQRERLRRRVLWGALAASLLIATAGGWALVEKRRADVQLASAERALGFSVWANLGFANIDGGDTTTIGEIDALWKAAMLTGPRKEGFVRPLLSSPLNQTIISRLTKNPDKILRTLGFDWLPAANRAHTIDTVLQTSDRIDSNLMYNSQFQGWAAFIRAFTELAAPQERQRILSSLLESILRTANEFSDGVEPFAQTVRTLSDNLAIAEVSAACAPTIDTFASLKDNDKIHTIARVLQGAAPRLDAEQSDRTLHAALSALARSDTSETTSSLMKLVQSLNLKLTEQQATTIRNRLVEQFDPAADFVKALVELPGRLNDSQLTTLLSKMRERLSSASYSSEEEAQAGTQLRRLLANLTTAQTSNILSPFVDEMVIKADEFTASKLLIKSEWLNSKQQSILLSRAQFNLAREKDSLRIAQLSELIGSLSAQLKMEKAASAAASLVVAAISRTSAPSDLEDLARALKALSVPANENQVKAIGKLLPLLARATDGNEKRQLANALAATVGILPSNQRTEAMKLLVASFLSATELGRPDDMREADATLDAGEIREALLVFVEKSSPAEAQETFAYLRQQLGERTSIPDRTARNSDDMGYLDRLTLLSAALKIVASRLSPEHVAAASLDLIALHESLAPLWTLPSTASSHRVGTYEELGKAFQVIAPALTQDARERVLAYSRIRLAESAADATSEAWSKVALILMKEFDDAQFREAVFDLLKFPTNGSVATRILLRGIHQRFPNSPDGGAPLYDFIEWFRSNLTADVFARAPVRPQSRDALPESE